MMSWIKAIIIDDEPHVLEGLKAFDLWEEFGIEIVTLFSDSERAMAYLKDHEVDLIITDIRMPGINGLELSERLQHYKCNFEVVLMSGYKDFDQVRKAMDLGIHYYLTKPVFEEELAVILKKVTDQLRAERERQNLTRLYELESIKAYLYDEEDLLEGLSLTYEKRLAEDLVRLLGLVFVPSKMRLSKNDGLAMESESLRVYMQELEETNLNGNLMVLPLKESYGLVTYLLIGEGEAVKSLSQEVDKYEGVPSQFSQPIHSIEELKVLALDLENQLKWQYPTKKDMPPQVLQSRQKQSIQVRDQMVSIMSEAIHRQDKERFETTYAQTLELAVKESDSLEQVAITLLEYLDKVVEAVALPPNKKNQWFLESDVSFKPYSHNMTLLNYFFYDRFAKLDEMVKGSLGQIKDDFALEVDTFIRDNLMEGITIKNLAAHVHMHPTYLGQKLQNQWGESFTKHINRLKIERAVALLGDNSRIEEIAQEVGYKNYHQFLKYFKLFMGKTPCKYMEEET